MWERWLCLSVGRAKAACTLKFQVLDNVKDAKEIVQLQEIGLGVVAQRDSRDGV